MRGIANTPRIRCSGASLSNCRQRLRDQSRHFLGGGARASWGSGALPSRPGRQRRQQFPRPLCSPVSAFMKATTSAFSWLGQVELLDVLVERRVRVAPLVVVLDDLFQGLQAAVVHVRCGLLDVAHRRRLECARGRPSVLGADRSMAPTGRGRRTCRLRRSSRCPGCGTARR